MAVTIQHDSSGIPRQSTRERLQREESYLHFVARESQWVLRIIAICSAGATILLMFTIFYLAFIPAMTMLLSYCLLLIADYIEYRTHKPGDPGWEDELPPTQRAAIAAEDAMVDAATVDPAAERVQDAVTARLTKTLIGILAAMAIVSLVVAAIFLDFEVLAIGGMILFCYWLFIAAPLWLGWLEDEAEEETHRAEEESYTA